jgi:hypothetical protein
MPGGKYRSIKWPRVYNRLKAKGFSKEKAARISNAMAGKGFRGRKGKSGPKKGKKGR